MLLCIVLLPLGLLSEHKEYLNSRGILHMNLDEVLSKVEKKEEEGKNELKEDVKVDKESKSSFESLSSTSSNTPPKRSSPPLAIQSATVEQLELSAQHHACGNKEWQVDQHTLANITKAIGHWTAAIDIAPADINTAKSYSNRSTACLDMNWVSHALEDANTTVLLRPNWAKGYLRQVQAYLRNNQVSFIFFLLIIACICICNFI